MLALVLHAELAYMIPLAPEKSMIGTKKTDSLKENVMEDEMNRFQTKRLTRPS